jgi:hypothetical protein
MKALVVNALGLGFDYEDVQIAQPIKREAPVNVQARNRPGDRDPIALSCGTAVVHDEGCLVQRQLLDPREAICRLKRKGCARGHAPEERRTARLIAQQCLLSRAPRHRATGHYFRLGLDGRR